MRFDNDVLPISLIMMINPPTFKSKLQNGSREFTYIFDNDD